MKITPLWVSIALSVPGVLADRTEPTATSASATASTSTAPTCTASLITTLCDYPAPDNGFAVAEGSKGGCFDYCNDNQPCDFVIWNPGNPYLGTGTCWLYPGESFDKSKGSTDCGNPFLPVYGKPTCSGAATTTTTSDSCTATVKPSAIASVCDYPPPSEYCFYECSASTGAPDCLSQCAKADSCAYAVFNPHDSNSPYASGNCWIYPNGTYEAESASKCTGSPTQFVYNNECPKETSSSGSSSTSGSTTQSSSGTATTGAAPASTSSGSNSAPTAFSPMKPLALGAAALMLRAL